ncbi:MAG: hypothetical protein PHF29_01990 [Candidatus Riflebacteria bacterium]|nr:hypothetical protein [Candidatus Riflebacteria bacterium]
MKKFAGFSMFLLVCVLFAFMVNVEEAISESTTSVVINEGTIDADSESEEGALLEDSEESLLDGIEDTGEEVRVTIPESADMTLGIQDSDNVMPANFRGGDPDSGLVNALEDVYYVKHEHSLIYEEDAQELAENTTFASDPNITWDTKMKNADGTYEDVEAPKNTNMAADGGEFFLPGEYQIGNSGARQVGEVPSVEDEEEEGNEEATTVTAQQSMGVKVHDVTAPDLWIAFQETAGSRSIPQSEEALIGDLKENIIKNAGHPFSTEPNNEEFQTKSFIFIEEGEDTEELKERDKEPWDKTARVTLAGTLFNEDGMVDVKSAVFETKLLSKEDQTRLAQVVGGSDHDLKGIFVRRNVPFIFAATATDNGDRRKSAAIESYNVEARLEYRDGSPVEKVGDAYLFRVQNYPVEEHKDQEVYTFIARAKDLSGNVTEIAVPVYVVDTQASFEGRR